MRAFCVGQLRTSSRRSLERVLLLAATLVFVAACVPYVQTLGFGFIYDDYWTVVGNAHLDKPLGSLLAAMASGQALRWGMPDATRPLMGLSLWLDRRFFGLSPAGHHLDSTLLYALVSVAVGALCFALLRRWVAALAAGLAFAVSPLHSEVVAAVNYREDLLAALAVFAALTLLHWPSSRVPHWRIYAASAAWFGALLSKESACAAPLLLAASCLVRRPPRALSKQAVRLGASALILGSTWLAWRLWLSHLGEQIPRAELGTFAQTLLRTARYEAWAVGSSLFPVLARPEHAPLPAASAAWLLVSLPIPLLAWCWWRFIRLRVPIGAVAITWVASLGTSPLSAPINELGDRYCFVGSLGFALLVGWLALEISRKSAVSLAIGVTLLSLFGIAQSWRAARAWGTEVDLWTTAVATAPHSGRAWASLSRVHRLAAQDELAERTALRALDERPGFVPALVALVLNDLVSGRVALARQRLASIRAVNATQRDNLRVASRCAEQPTELEASECVRRAVPRGMVLGDTERLRTISTRLLGPPSP